jgi:hypothetical protein
MATKDQGTGQHKHKSSEEPFAHHEAPTTSGSKSEHTSSAQHASAGEAGKGERGGSSHEGSGSRSRESRGSESRGSSSESDLRSREYTGPDGQQHHHTKTYEEQHKGDKKSAA